MNAKKIDLTLITSWFFIEAKLTSGNETTPSDKNNLPKYRSGGNNWFEKVFTSDYKTIAMTEKKYELMRSWLLGTWMAKQTGKEFYLINLVREGQEEDIEAVFKSISTRTKKEISQTHMGKHLPIHLELECSKG